MRLLSTTFYFPFYHFPLSVPHISTLLPLFLLPPTSLLPPPPPPSSSFLGPRAGAAITGGGMDSFALMWFGLQRGTAQSDTFSQRTELLSLSVCSSCVFKQTNQHHSAVLACLSPPSHHLCSQCVCTKLPALFHTHTHVHTIISICKLQLTDSPFLLSLPSFLHSVFLQTTSTITSLPCFSLC